ncbi:MAG TPA: hypothetical protein DF712_01410 [Balneola sp.]|nr:hypothetical protein [Balneola sp.]
MGGVAGHMDHLYDNPELTFAKMKEIMTAASNGELSTEEKVDGQNLFLSYSIPEGKAKGARNKGNLRTGGLDAAALATKFAGRGGLEKAFSGGFSAFEQAVEALSPQEKQKIFGPDTNIWYNAEVMDPGTEGDVSDPGSVNVIKYDDKTLKIHNVGHFIFDRESGEKEPIPEGTLEILDNALERMQQRLHGHDFSLARQAIIQLQKLEDDTILSETFARLQQELSSEGLNDNSTMQDYMVERLQNGLNQDLPENIRKELVKYLLKMPDSIGKRQLKKGLNPEIAAEIDSIISAKTSVLREAIEPIEMIVHDFTVEILKGLKSVFIADTDREVSRLKDELSTAVKAITKHGEQDPDMMSIMQKQLNKIKDFSQITTPVEAVVFDYDGHTYKFAGNFAPLNQILGMFRYPKKGKILTSENITLDSEVLVDKKGKRVALIPGGFKPPHAGHYLLAKYFANKKDVDEVYVIVSTKSRPPVTVETAIKLWELYTREDPKIKVMAGSTPSPVGDVYELIADNNVFQKGDTALLGKSEKDTDDKRFDRAQSYAERNNPGVNVEAVITPLFAGGVSGTQMRNLLVMGDEGKQEFKNNLPRHLDAEQREEAYLIASENSMMETFDNIIDSTIEEMSAMSSGAVSGVSSGFGSPNTFNPYAKKRSKTRKPKVNRAKRQRRR